MAIIKIVIWHSHICEIGGVETFLYNFCLNFKDYYDILVLYGGGSDKQISRFEDIVEIEKYNETKEYHCDICLRNSVWGIIPEQIKANRYIEMQHADYMHLKNKGVLSKQYFVWDKVKENVAVGEYVKEQFKKATGRDSKVIRNILAPKQKLNKILKLITCARLDTEKGFNRMMILAKMLREANIKFRWDIYSIIDYKGDEDIFIHKPRYDIVDYVADADYTVLLSDCEGLPYTVQESLQYGTPCIVTDIKGCTELITDGENGYVVPLNMNFDINKIVTIPKFKQYKSTSQEEWFKYLGGAEFKVKPILKNTYTVIQAYRDMKLNRIMNIGDKIELLNNRANELKNKGFIQ